MRSQLRWLYREALPYRRSTSGGFDLAGDGAFRAGIPGWRRRLALRSKFPLRLHPRPLPNPYPDLVCDHRVRLCGPDSGAHPHRQDARKDSRPLSHGLF